MVKIWPKSSQELSNNIWFYLEYAIISDYPLSHSNFLLKNELYEVSFIHDFRIDSKRIYLPKELGLALINGEIKMRKDILNKLKIEKELERMVYIVMNNPPQQQLMILFLEAKMD